MRPSRLPLLVTVLLLGSLVAMYFLWPGFQSEVNQGYEVLTSDDPARIEQWVNQFGAWGPVIVVVAMVLQMFLLVVPTWGLMIVNVLAFGPVWGTLLSLGGIAAASTLGYVIGDALGEVTVERIVGTKTERKMARYVEDYGLWTVFVARLAPFLSNDAISFVGGLLEMGYWRFIGATLAGITPLAILIAVLGQDVDRLKTGLIIGSAVCLVLLVGYIVWDRRRKA